MANPIPLQAWLEAVNARDLNRVLGLYAEDAVLMATFAPKAIRREADRRAYFEQLAARPGLKVSLHDRTVRSQLITDGWEIVSGIYRFELEIDDEPLTFEARFTIVLNPNAERPILHHHSSQIPRILS